MSHFECQLNRHFGIQKSCFQIGGNGIQKISIFFRKPSLSVRSRTQHWRVLDMNKYLDFIIYSIGGWKRSSQTFYWLIPVTSLDMPYQLKNLRKPMSIVLGFSKEFIGSVMRALKYKMFYITLIFIAEKIRAMLFIFCTSCIRLMNFVWLVVKM